MVVDVDVIYGAQGKSLSALRNFSVRVSHVQMEREEGEWFPEKVGMHQGWLMPS